jgi:hypothetical protein
MTTTAQEVLQRTAGIERGKLDQALAELRALASDEEIRDTYGVDPAELRREVDWGQVWSLP